MLPFTMSISHKGPNGRKWPVRPTGSGQRRETHPRIEARAAPVTAAYMAESDFAASVEREHQELARHQKRVSEGIQCLREMGIPTP